MATIPGLSDGVALAATDYFIVSRAPHNAAAANFRLTIGQMINATNMQITSGFINTIQNISTASSPAFAGMRITTSPVAGYFLQTDASGNGTWQPVINSGVLSATGTANQVLINGTVATPQTGNITLTLPQSIATTSTPQFGGMTLSATGSLTLAMIATTLSGFVVQTFRTNSVNAWRIGSNLSGTGANEFSFQRSNTAAVLSLFQSGNVVIGSSADDGSHTLQVNGSLLTNGFTLTGGALGDFLICIGSGEASWVPMNLYVVTSIAGTPHQIDASVAMGDVILSLTNGISLGSYQATTPPTGGILASGKVSFGSNTPDSSSYFYITPTATAAAGVANLIISTGGTATAVANSNQLGHLTLGSYVVATAGFTGLLYSSLTITNSVVTKTGVGTLTTAYGVYSDAFSSLATNQYAGFFKAPTGGTVNTSIFTDNIVVGSGFQTTASITDGIRVGGRCILRSGGSDITQAYFQLTPVISASSGTAYGMFLGAGTLTATANSDTITWINMRNTTIARAGFTGLVEQMFYVDCAGTSVSGGGSSGFAYGVRVSGFSSHATNQYSGYFLTPSGGTVNTSIYTDNLVVGTTFLTNNAPSNGAIIVGSTYIGASSAQASGALLQTTRTGYNYTGSDGTSIGGIYINSASTQPVMFGSYSNHNVGFFTNNGNATFTIATNGGVCVGGSYASSTPPANGAIIQSNVSIGSSSANSLFNVGSSNQFQINSLGFLRIGGAPSGTIQFLMNQIFLATSGALAALQIQSPMGASSGTVAEVDTVFLYTDLSVNVGTTTLATSLNIGGGVTGGTVTTGVGININALAFGSARYGIKVAVPSGGSPATAIYGDNLVIGSSNVNNSPPANGAIIQGSVKWGTSTTGAGTALLGANSPAVTNTAPYVWLTMISSDGSTVYVPAWK